jgi:hypothetical protein
MVDALKNITYKAKLALPLPKFEAWDNNGTF